MIQFERTPDDTRQAILEAAFEEIYEHGFQAASLSRILERVDVTKGALYHHFKSKKELGYAVVDEVVGNWVTEKWQFDADSPDPISSIRRTIEGALERASERTCHCGCPLNNLAQEMSPIDEGFRERINSVFRLWRTKFEDAFRAGQAAGTVRPDVDVEKLAAFLVASFEGIVGLGKSEQSLEFVSSTLDVMLDYLETLRPQPAVV
ncbi:MAG: TetR/AcrR family transcriptional regulator [Gemmatimonadota bacterium]